MKENLLQIVMEVSQPSHLMGKHNTQVANTDGKAGIQQSNFFFSSHISIIIIDEIMKQTLLQQYRKCKTML